MLSVSAIGVQVDENSIPWNYFWARATAPVQGRGVRALHWSVLKLSEINVEPQGRTQAVLHLISTTERFVCTALPWLTFSDLDQRDVAPGVPLGLQRYVNAK